MSDQQTPRPPDEDEPIQPPILPAIPDEEEERVLGRPWLRRTALIIYVTVVICVIIGLVALSFPWGDLDIPFDPPFRFPESI